MHANLSKLELHLLESQELLETRGKGGRGVPVIIPKDMQPALQFISSASVRRESGILPNNIYLFPNTKLGALRAYDSLKKTCNELKLQQPEQITSVNMRKYTATISQIFDMTTQEQQWLMNNLGHSMDIHKIHYRQTSGVIERVDIAKLMLMQEFNIAGKYAGKQLGDIDLSELVFGSETGILTALDADQSANSDEAAPLNGFSEDEVKPDLQIVETFDEYEFQDDEKDRPTSKRKTATNRVTWTKEEVVEIEQYFKENLSTGTTPGLKECQKAIQMSLKNSGILQRRSWETLKKKVWNMIKIKRL